MKRTIWICAAAVMMICGCAQQPTFTGSLKINKANGSVTSVEVQFPSSSYTLRNRLEASRLIDQIESTLADLKMARDSMPVDESSKTTPPVTPPEK
jgi:hypothetical protein